MVSFLLLFPTAHFITLEAILASRACMVVVMDKKAQKVKMRVVMISGRQAWWADKLWEMMFSSAEIAASQ